MIFDGFCKPILRRQRQNGLRFFVGVACVWFGASTCFVCGQEVVLDGGVRVAKEPLHVVYQQIRGLVQNELNIIADACKPNDEQAQRLLDLAESGWMSLTNREVTRRMQQHVHGTIDFDGLIERNMLIWCKESLTPDQVVTYEQELLDRQAYRKEALIAKVLVWLQEKLNLSADQVNQVEEVLRTRWKDRWYRSIEATFDNETLLPEINRTWLEEILTNSQRNALAVRSPMSKPQPANADYPVLALSKRFKIGSLVSSSQIELLVSHERKAAQGNEATP